MRPDKPLMAAATLSLSLAVLVAAGLDASTRDACQVHHEATTTALRHVASDANLSVVQLDRAVRRLENQRGAFEAYAVRRADELDRDYLPEHRHGIEAGTPESAAPPVPPKAEPRTVGVSSP